MKTPKVNYWILLLILLLPHIIYGQHVLDLESDPAHLYYPFDNSAYKDTNGNICNNLECGTNQYKMVCGYNCGAHSNMDLYAQDWNYQYGDNDCGKKIFAPIGGQVIFAGQVGGSSGSCCFGNQVIIKSLDHVGKAMRIAHMGSIDVANEAIITPGTLVGTIGDSGGGCHNICPNDFTCHAHIAFYSHLTPDEINTLDNGLFIVDENNASPFLLDVNPISINGHLPIYGGAFNTPKNNLRIRFELSEAYFNSDRDFPTTGLNTGMVNTLKLINAETGYSHSISSISDFQYIGFDATHNSHQYYCEVDLSNQTFATDTEYHIELTITDGTNNVNAFERSQLYFTNEPSTYLIGEDDNWYKDFFIQFVEEGFFQEDFVSDQRFAETINREEVAKMLAIFASKADLMLIPEGDVFDDVPKDHPYYPYIYVVKNLGLMNGVSSNTFGLGQDIDRAQLSKVLVSAMITPDDPDGNGLDECGVGDLPFVDVPSSEWYCKWINHLTQEGIVEGYPDGTFKPGQTPNKAEFLKFFINSLEYYKILLGTEVNLLPTNNDFYELGSQFEFTGAPYGNRPNINIETHFYEIPDNEVLFLDLENDFDFNGDNLYFYWFSEEEIISEVASHRKISFTPPTVLEPTDFLIYYWVGSNNGKIEQGNITVRVCLSSDDNCNPDNEQDAGDFTVSAYNLNYEDTWVSGLRDKYWTIMNASGQPLRIKGEITSGATHYRIRSQGGVNNDGVDVTLQPWEEETYKIAFDPAIIGLQTGRLSLYYGPDLENSFILPLSGVAFDENPVTILAPDNLLFNDPREFGFNVNFVKDDDAVRHTIEYADNPAFDNPYSENFLSTLNLTTRRIRPPAYGEWWVRVRSENLSLSLESPWSETRSYNWYVNTTPIIFDSDLTPSDRDTLSNYNNVTLNFSGHGGNGTLSYTVWLATSVPESHPPIVQNTTDTSYVLTDLLPNQTYYWKVRVEDEDGDCNDTNIIQFTTAPDPNPPTCAVEIDNGAATTTSMTVTLNLNASSTNGVLEYMRFSNDGSSWSYWYPYASVYGGWNLLSNGGFPGEGERTVYIQVRDNSDNTSSCQDNIIVASGSPGVFMVRGELFSSLRLANEYAVAGDTIYATAGTFDLTNEVDDSPYSHNSNSVGIAFKDSVSLIGAGAENTILTWSDGAYGMVLRDHNFVQGVTITRAAPSSGTRRTVIIAGHHSTLSHCIISDGSASIETHTSDGPWEDILIRNCIIKNNQKGIRLDNLIDLKFINNVIAGNGGTALNIPASNTNAIVSNNIFYQNPNGGVFLNGVTTTYSYNCMFQQFTNDHPNTNGNIEIEPHFFNYGTGIFAFNLILLALIRALMLAYHFMNLHQRWVLLSGMA